MNKKLSAGVMFGYGAAALSYNFVWSMVSAYITPFFFNVMGISVAVTGLIVLIARIWDGFNDPMMGAIVDKTNTKRGRYRPYLLLGIIPLVTSVILLFLNPDMSPQLKVFYGAAVYIFFGMSYTFANIPYLSMTSTMTHDPDERTVLMTVKNIFVLVGSMVPSILITSIAISDEGYSEDGFLLVAIIGAALLTITMLITYVSTRNHKYVGNQHGPKITWADRLNAVKKNPPLQLMMWVMLVFSLQAILMGAQTLFVVDALGKGDQALTFSLVMLPGMLIAMGLMAIVKRLEKSRVVQLGMIITIVGAVIFQLAPNNNMTLLLVATFIKAVGFGFVGIILFSMIADCVDFARSVTGSQQGGVVFSLVTFVQKAIAGIGALALTGYLTLIGYKAQSIGIQTEAATFGLKSLNGIVPILFSIIVYFVMTKYPLTKEKMKEINQDLIVELDSAE